MSEGRCDARSNVSGSKINSSPVHSTVAEDKKNLLFAQTRQNINQKVCRSAFRKKNHRDVEKDVLSADKRGFHRFHFVHGSRPG